MTTSLSPHPQALTVEALAAALRPVAAMWFTKGECLALEALIGLAAQAELRKTQNKVLQLTCEQYATMARATP